MQKRSVVLGTLACVLSLISGRAQAAYTYTTAFVLSSPTSGVVINNALGTATLGTTIVTFSPQAGGKAVPSTNSLNLGDVTATSAGTGSGDSFVINFTDTTTITNVPLPGSALPLGTLAFSGTYTVSNATSTTGTVIPSNLAVVTGTTNAGGVTFNLTSPNASNPTINGAGGNVSAVINAISPVPAPTSLVMLGMGMGAMGLVRARRRFLAA